MEMKRIHTLLGEHIDVFVRAYTDAINARDTAEEDRARVQQNNIELDARCRGLENTLALTKAALARFESLYAFGPYDVGEGK